MGKKASYVFGGVVGALVDVGYGRGGIEGGGYDWRLPLGKLEERDGYFSDLQFKVGFFIII